MTLQEKIVELGITAKAERVASNPNMEDWDGATHWRVTLYGLPRDRFFVVRHRMGQYIPTMSVYFSQVAAYTEPPTAYDVLYSLVVDTAGVEGSFAEWCDDFGYDTDSRKAERTYKVIRRQREKLRHLLGDHYEAVLNAERE